MQKTSQSNFEQNTKLTLVISQQEVAKASKIALKKLAKKHNAPGFRKGKAPVSMVAQKISNQELIDYILKITLPSAYQKEIQAQNLKPITQPRFKIEKINPESDWVVEAEFGLLPTIYVTDAQIAKDAKKIKQEYLKKQNLDEEKTNNKQTESEKITTQVIIGLSELYQPAIPPILLEEKLQLELDKTARVLQQIGFTFAQYLKRLNMSQDSFITQIAQDLKKKLQYGIVVERLKLLVSGQTDTNKQQTENSGQKPKQLAELKKIEKWLAKV